MKNIYSYFRNSYTIITHYFVQIQTIILYMIKSGTYNFIYHIHSFSGNSFFLPFQPSIKFMTMIDNIHDKWFAWTNMTQIQFIIQYNKLIYHAMMAWWDHHMIIPRTIYRIRHEYLSEQWKCYHFNSWGWSKNQFKNLRKQMNEDAKT